MLVDLTPEALQERLRAGQGLPAGPRRGRAAELLPRSTTSRRCASSRCARSPRTSRRGGTRTVLDPLSQQAVAERILALVDAGAALAADPAPRLALGAAARRRDRRALGAPARAQSSARRRRSQLAALRRLASILGAHFLEEEGDDLVDDRAAGRRASAARPTSSSARPTSRGGARSCAARSSRSSSASCPAIDIRVVADRALRGGGRRDDGLARSRVAAVALGLVARRGRDPPAPAARRPARPRRPRSSCRSPAARSTRRCSTAAIRIARAEDATLVPAYLIVVPLELRRGRSDAARRSTVAMPLLEAVEHAALRAGVPVDARIESGRTPIHALQRLWDASTSTASSSRPRPAARPGSRPKDLTWMLTHAPSRDADPAARPRSQRLPRGRFLGRTRSQTAVHRSHQEKGVDAKWQGSNPLGAQVRRGKPGTGAALVVVLLRKFRLPQAGARRRRAILSRRAARRRARAGGSCPSPSAAARGRTRARAGTRTPRGACGRSASSSSASPSGGARVPGDHERLDDLSAQLVGDADDRGRDHRRMPQQALLDLERGRSGSRPR